MTCAQGKAEMVERFRNSHFMCRNTEYLPVVFRPPRDGANPAASSVTVVGRCMPPQWIAGEGTRFLLNNHAVVRCVCVDFGLRVVVVVGGGGEVYL